MRVLLDCDGVLLDWESAFRTWVTARLRRPISAQPSSWDLSKWLGVDRDDTDRLVRDFNHSASFGNLAPVYGSQWALSALVNAGAELHVITSCSDAGAVADRRRANLEHHFGAVFASVTCLPLHCSKVKSLVSHSPGAIWVEDNYTNAVIGERLGHRSFVLRYSHNKSYEGHPGPTWCDDWVGVLRSLLTDNSEAGVVVTDSSLVDMTDLSCHATHV